MLIWIFTSDLSIQQWIEHELCLFHAHYNVTISLTINLNMGVKISNEQIYHKPMNMRGISKHFTKAEPFSIWNRVWALRPAIGCKLFKCCQDQIHSPWLVMVQGVIYHERTAVSTHVRTEPVYQTVFTNWDLPRPQQLTSGSVPTPIQYIGILKTQNSRFLLYKSRMIV